MGWRGSRRESVKRSGLTFLGIAIVAVSAILIAKGALHPAKESVERSQDVLTKAYEAKLIECFVVEDADLPKTLARPKVDEDLLYIQVAVLYPGVDRVPSPLDHVLDSINGLPGTELKPVHTSYDEDEAGAYLLLIYQTDLAFESARMVHKGELLFERILLD